MSIGKILTAAAVGTILGTWALRYSPYREELLESIVKHGLGLKKRSRKLTARLFDEGLNRLNLEKRGYAVKSGLAGILIGITATLLLAPKNGRDTRKHIQRLYHKLSGKTQSAIKELRTPQIFSFNSTEPIYPAKRHKKTPKTAARV